MNEPKRTSALSLLRLIVELRGSNMATNDVYLGIIGEREVDELAEELDELEAQGLISWSEGGEQWTPTMRGLLIAMGMSAYEPAVKFDLQGQQDQAECA